MILADMMLVAGWMAWGLYALIVLLWLHGHLELTRAVRALSLRPAEPSGAPPSPRVTVIVAAHNEAGGIRACLERIAAQDYPELRVIVANDRSTDATGGLVRGFAKTHPQVTCLDINELPAGWLGKAHALSVAAHQADGELLVFTDADVVWHPRLLWTVTEHMVRERLDLLSLWPKVVVASFWEGLLLPACGWLLLLWCRNRQPERVEQMPAFANGQLLAIRRAAYEQLGGFAAVRDELAEDVALARRAQAAGMRRYMGIGRELLTTRMYENLGQTVAGWTRIFAGVLQARWRMMLSIVAVGVGVWSALAVLIVLAARAGCGAPWGAGSTAWLVAAGVHLAAMYTLLRRHFATSFDGRTYLPLFPLALVGVVVLLVRAALVASGRATVRWGGMRYVVRGSRAVARNTE